MRKGQSETMGLLVIVILFIVIGMIYLRFRLADTGNDYGDVRNSIEANNLLKAVMKLKIGGIDVNEMIWNCHEEADKCRMLERELDSAFKSSLSERLNFGYVLKANELEILRFGECSLGIVGSFIAVRDGVVFESRLTLCNK